MSGCPLPVVINSGTFFERAYKGEFNAAFLAKFGYELNDIEVAATSMEDDINFDIIYMREFEGDISPVCPEKMPEELANRSTYEYLTEYENGYYVYGPTASVPYVKAYENANDAMVQFYEAIKDYLLDGVDLWPNLVEITGTTFG